MLEKRIQDADYERRWAAHLDELKTEVQGRVRNLETKLVARAMGRDRRRRPGLGRGRGVPSALPGGVFDLTRLPLVKRSPPSPPRLVLQE